MNLYEAIFVRRSVRQYRMEPIEQSVLDRIAAFYESITPLAAGIRTEIGITENFGGRRILKGLFGVRAPYYLSIYSERRDRAEMNAGFIGEQLCLYMATLGIGSCFLGASRIADAPEVRGDKSFMVLIAFGLPKGTLTRRTSDAKRLPMKELCALKDHPASWAAQVLEAGRLAPSAMNQQPWRFVVIGRKIHIFCRKGSVDRLKKWDEVNFGILCSHIAIASDVLWLDLDLIRLENISQKSFRVNQYVLSAVARTQEWEKNAGSAEGSETTSAPEEMTGGIDMKEQEQKDDAISEEEFLKLFEQDNICVDINVSDGEKERITVRREKRREDV